MNSFNRFLVGTASQVGFACATVFLVVQLLGEHDHSQDIQSFALVSIAGTLIAIALRLEA
jgi:hypothetical protein